MALDGTKKVGFIPVHPDLIDDVPIDIDDTFTLSIDDGAVLII